MNLLSLVRRIFSHPHPVAYTLGRFPLARRATAKMIALRQRFTAVLAEGNPLERSQESIFCEWDQSRAFAGLCTDAVTPYFMLRPDYCEQIKQFSLTEPCFAAEVPGTFQYHDVQDGRLPNGVTVATGHVQEPLRCPAVANVVENKALDALVEQYLGYQIRGKDVLMWWSFASAMSPELRRARYQTIDFHFDVHALNFCYLHVYLTETDRSSGAHVLVKGSHRRKPIRWLFGSARQTDEAIATQYGDANIVTIEGPAGTAFLEDTSCYHKALAPSSHDRLMLQVRYF